VTVTARSGTVAGMTDHAGTTIEPMSRTSAASAERTWWQDAVVYQIYPRSWADSDGDGIGDLRGIASRLDHLAELGIDAIWLSPISPSPNKDWGYDVADYVGVHPDLGTIEDADHLVREAHARNIRVLLDLVPNHSSDQHAWFVESRSSTDNPKRDWYVWADPAPDGGPPNNWLSVFGGPAWTLDEASGQYYLHNFLPEQPDLNWWNQEVNDAMDDVLRWWFDRGVDGFRIDVCHGIVKDRELRDNPTTPPEIPVDGGLIEGLNEGGLEWYQDRVYSMNRPEVHDVLRRWRRIADDAGDRVLLGETWAPDIDALAKFYGAQLDELHLAFNFHLTMDTPTPRVLADHLASTLDALPEGAWPAWTLSNHDISRCATRWCDGDARLAANAMVLLLALPGTPVLYYGDEIGMVDVEVPVDRLEDPVGIRRIEGKHGRDGVRTPMQWDRDGGFSATGEAEPWLPMGDAAARNVADQTGDAGSVLENVRAMIALRRARADLRRGTYAEHHVDDQVWAWTRGDSILVACNLDPSAGAVVPDVAGSVLLATQGGVELAHGGLRLPAGAAAVIELA
jgi:alpha-glucosidase